MRVAGSGATGGGGLLQGGTKGESGCRESITAVLYAPSRHQVDKALLGRVPEGGAAGGPCFFVGLAVFPKSMAPDT